MKYLVAGMLMLCAFVFVAPTPAQLIFAKKGRPNPTQRVPELIVIVKSDPDERKRMHAAEELRDYDATTFTEIVPVLADVLLTDKKQSVRSEALTSLSKIRPVSKLAGNAMERAAAQDETLRVRMQAKSALTKYYLAGYSPRKNDGVSKQSNEPPLGETPSVAKVVSPPTAVKSASPPPAPTTVDAPFPRPLPAGLGTPKEAPPVEGPSLFPK